MKLAKISGNCVSNLLDFIIILINIIIVITIIIFIIIIIINYNFCLAITVDGQCFYNSFILNHN
jgi:hypothetical protein